ncbi:MAG: hypothetical protein AAF985_17235, partial [Bacteroidota bacterium]
MYELYFGVVTLLAIYYIYIVGKYIRGWKSLPHWRVSASFQPGTFITVLIPARNEANNIVAC